MEGRFRGGLWVSGMIFDKGWGGGGVRWLVRGVLYDMRHLQSEEPKRARLITPFLSFIESGNQNPVRY